MTSLQRIETLPGDGRYAVTFTGSDRVEQTAVVHVDGEAVAVAAASLPAGWAVGSAPFEAVAEALRALERARDTGDTSIALIDVDGGWDVMIGNVVLEAGVPTCTAHGPMQATEAVYVCSECSAQATFR